MVKLTELVDPLGEALHHLRMRGVFYSRCEFSAPWGIELPAIADSLMFHVVINGSCWLESAGAERLRLQPGDLALMPHGAGHILRSDADARTPALFDLPRDAVSERYEVIRIEGAASRRGSCVAQSFSTIRRRGNSVVCCRRSSWCKGGARQSQSGSPARCA